MPDGYAFPQNTAAWVPFRYRAVDALPGTGPSLMVFGRLAEGASIESFIEPFGLFSNPVMRPLASTLSPSVVARFNSRKSKVPFS